jgi:uncharacterized protein DUF5681
MPRGGRRSTSFRPGVSGNPGGRPKKPAAIVARQLVADAKALAQQCAPEAVLTLKTIMLNEKAPPTARISAATAILDRGYGKPRQEVEMRQFNIARLNDEQLDELERLTLLMLDDDEMEATAH